MDNTNTKNRLIARADTRGKVIDFQDNLIRAYAEDYAMLHGAGGKKHAARSGIQVGITDYKDDTVKKNGSSVYAKGIVPVYEFEILADICKRNIAEANACAGKEAVIADTVWKNSSLFFTLVGVALGSLREILTAGKELDFNGKVTALGKWLKESYTSALVKEPHPGFPKQYDYANTIEKVNPYQVGEDGYAPVTLIKIVRTGIRNGSELAGLPWSITISNFSAKTKEAANGTVSYNGTDKRDEKTATISLSDRELYRCCSSVNHFVNVWEIGTSSGLVRDTYKEREEARKSEP